MAGFYWWRGLAFIYYYFPFYFYFFIFAIVLYFTFILFSPFKSTAALLTYLVVYKLQRLFSIKSWYKMFSVIRYVSLGFSIQLKVKYKIVQFIQVKRM